MIGTDNPTFFSGQTDLWGVFVAEGVHGQVTAVARKGAGQYAFYRGKARVGALPPPPGQGQDRARRRSPDETLDNNLKIENSINQNRQIDRLQDRYKPMQQGVNPF